MIKQCLILASSIAAMPLLSTGCNQTQMSSQNPKTTGAKMTFPENEFWRKGGVGAICGDIYIDFNSDKNRLLLADKETWEGLVSAKHEFVIIYNNKTYDQSELPNDFKISKAVIVSFEANRVYFYDFNVMEGGYYSRGK
jgi:hypothetical protein